MWVKSFERGKTHLFAVILKHGEVMSDSASRAGVLAVRGWDCFTSLNRVVGNSVG